jgi:hypothetical protein
MDLVGQCLDKLVVDREGLKSGRVDGIVLELADGKPPRVAFIEIGPSVQARRYPRWLAALVRWALRKVSSSDDNAVLRVPFDKLKPQRNEVVAPIGMKETPGGRLEKWVRDQIVARLPGA